MNNRYWCGIRGVYQIWHGQWADPEVKYKNYVCNEWDLQESMYITMKDRIEDGEDWGDPDNDDDFINFCRKNADLVKQDIIELSSGGVYESIKHNRKRGYIKEEIDTGQYASAQERREMGEYRRQEMELKRKKYAKEYEYIHTLKNLYEWIWDDCKIDVEDDLLNAISKIKKNIQ